MTRPSFNFACQTFTWEMLGAGWTGGPDDLVTAISAAGYRGIEITDRMIGSYAARPKEFAQRLADAGLELVSFAFGSDSGFTEAALVEADLEIAKCWVEFAAHFPGALISMGSATVMSEGSRAQKFDVAADVYNRTAEIGRQAGVVVAVHPSSHHNTLLLSRADYDALFARLNPQVGWVPDTGHILRGGQVMEATLRAYLERIRYLHLKDVDATGTWAMLGAGVCEIDRVIATVAEAPQFNGWIVVEEDSETAGRDPAAAVRVNLQTLLGLKLAGVSA
jgi:sugar phosphate isomerase/epimerase